MNTEEYSPLPEWTAYACRFCHQFRNLTDLVSYADGGCAGNCGLPRNDSPAGRANALVEAGRCIGHYVALDKSADAKLWRERADELLASHAKGDK